MFCIYLQISPETILKLRRTERDKDKKMRINLHVKYPQRLSDFNEEMNFHGIFSKNAQISNFMKIRPVRAEFFHAEQTDMTKLKIVFRNFSKAPYSSN